MVKNKIFDSWNKIKPSDATHERIINNISYQLYYGKKNVKKTPTWRVFVPVAACLFMVLSLALTIPYFLHNSGGDTGHIVIPHVPDDDVLITPLPGAPPLDISQPITPLNPADILTFEQAITDPYFGMFIPDYIPQGFDFEYAWRFGEHDGNSLTAFWQAEMLHNISWHITMLDDHNRSLIVSVNDREKFDLSLYPIPWAASVPRELVQYVMNPVFLAEELSLDVVQARTIQGRGRNPGDSNWQINFSVLIDDIVIRLDTYGVSPEQVWEMFLPLIG